MRRDKLMEKCVVDVKYGSSYSETFCDIQACQNVSCVIVLDQLWLTSDHVLSEINTYLIFSDILGKCLQQKCTGLKFASHTLVNGVQKSL